MISLFGRFSVTMEAGGPSGGMREGQEGRDGFLPVAVFFAFFFCATSPLAQRGFIPDLHLPHFASAIGDVASANCRR